MGTRRDRREFLASLLAGGCAACLLSGTAGVDPALAQDAAGGPSLIPPADSDLPLAPARWWKPLPGGRVECGLCPRKCRVADRERGMCGVRENRGGKYWTLVHSRPCTIHIDPVEKKPFYHVLPGTGALSLATPGCNIECRFCQNWQIAQVRPEQVKTFELRPEQVAALARKHRTPTIACTYTEPVVWSEYVQDIGVAARRAGVRTLLVSNGYINEEPLRDLLPVLAAVKIDLKSFREKFYREVCHGELGPVLDTLKRLKAHGTWTEIVVLVIPTLNDSREEFRDLARFVARELGPETPVHFTRFHPSYRLRNLPRTPVRTLEIAREVAREEGLWFPYVGNVPGHPWNSTYCPGCGALLIQRTGMAVLENRLRDGHCPKCGREIPGIWS